jgi:hypothetical protein
VLIVFQSSAGVFASQVIFQVDAVEQDEDISFVYCELTGSEHARITTYRDFDWHLTERASGGLKYRGIKKFLVGPNILY